MDAGLIHADQLCQRRIPQIALIFKPFDPSDRLDGSLSRADGPSQRTLNFVFSARHNYAIMQKANFHKGSAMKEIRFYRASEKPFGVFSNLYRRPITFEGRVYPTSEHAYQAGKARKEEVREWLMAAPSPALLAMAAHGLYQWDIAPEWSRIKFDRMRGVLMAKFTQHSDLATILIDTKDAVLIETATVDNAVNRLWGEVPGKGGKNMLGILLMEVRAHLVQNNSKRRRKIAMQAAE